MSSTPPQVPSSLGANGPAFQRSGVPFGAYTLLHTAEGYWTSSLHHFVPSVHCTPTPVPFGAAVEFFDACGTVRWCGKRRRELGSSSLHLFSVPCTHFLLPISFRRCIETIDEEQSGVEAGKWNGGGSLVRFANGGVDGLKRSMLYIFSVLRNVKH